MYINQGKITILKNVMFYNDYLENVSYMWKQFRNRVNRYKLHVNQDITSYQQTLQNSSLSAGKCKESWSTIDTCIFLSLFAYFPENHQSLHTPAAKCWELQCRDAATPERRLNKRGVKERNCRSLTLFRTGSTGSPGSWRGCAIKGWFARVPVDRVRPSDHKAKRGGWGRGRWQVGVMNDQQTFNRVPGIDVVFVSKKFWAKNFFLDIFRPTLPWVTRLYCACELPCDRLMCMLTFSQWPLKVMRQKHLSWRKWSLWQILELILIGFIQWHSTPPIQKSKAFFAHALDDSSNEMRGRHLGLMGPPWNVCRLFHFQSLNSTGFSNCLGVRFLQVTNWEVHQNLQVLVDEIFPGLQQCCFRTPPNSLCCTGCHITCFLCVTSVEVYSQTCFMSYKRFQKVIAVWDAVMTSLCL